MKKAVLEFPYFSLSIFPVVVLITLFLVISAINDSGKAPAFKDILSGAVTYDAATLQDINKPYNPEITGKPRQVNFIR